MSNNDQISGQKRSNICGLKNLDQSLDEIRSFLEKEKETEQNWIDRTICQAEADQAKAKVDQAKAEADQAEAEAAKIESQTWEGKSTLAN